jgi:hypothetical protein
MEDFRWQTKMPHSDNTQTMCDFLENHLHENFLVVLQDGSYAEITNKFTGIKYAVHAGGDGDFVSHRVTFIKL